MPAHDKPYKSINLSSAADIQQIMSVDTQNQFIEEIKRAIRYFFTTGEGSFLRDFPHMEDSHNFPFKGFILSGKPGTGKTEAVKQACSQLYSSLSNEGFELRLLHVNSANINRKGLGDNEQRLEEVFLDAQPTTMGSGSVRTVILFDDIETLLVKRTDEHTTEWSRSMNGVFFHQLDSMKTSKTIVIATTNQPDMVDDAVHSRLSFREVPPPTFDEMITVAQAALPPSEVKALLPIVSSNIQRALDAGDNASFRMARKSAIEVLIKNHLGWN